MRLLSSLSIKFVLTLLIGDGQSAHVIFAWGSIKPNILSVTLLLFSHMFLKNARATKISKYHLLILFRTAETIFIIVLLVLLG